MTLDRFRYPGLYLYGYTYHTQQFKSINRTIFLEINMEYKNYSYFTAS